MVARPTPLRQPHHEAAEMADLIANTPAPQRDSVVDALWIMLDTAKTLCDRADYDNRNECLARLRVLECISRNLTRCLESWD